MVGKRGTDEERFERFVIPEPNSGCLIWLGVTANDYPYFCYGKGENRRNGQVSHFVLEKKLGKPIPKGLFVCHKCDNTFCVAENHLFLGTAKENANDAKRKGRLLRAFKPQLTRQQVIDIFLDPTSNKKLAIKYNVDTLTIRAIKKRISWKSVTSKVAGEPPLEPKSLDEILNNLMMWKSQAKERRRQKYIANKLKSNVSGNR
jgi:hypothetical protein